jgi:hypothetical protein
MIGGCGHNGEQHLLLYDVSALHTVLVHPSYEGGHHPVAAASDPPDKTDTPLIIYNDIRAGRDHYLDLGFFTKKNYLSVACIFNFIIVS